MSHPKVTTAKSTPHRERTGQCLAANCQCQQFAPLVVIAGWTSCFACHHTQAVHDIEEKK